MRSYPFIILCSVLAVLSFAQQCVAGTVILVKEQFKESYSNEVKISGAVRAGVMHQSTIPSVIPEALYINLGSNSGSQLEVNIISFDGRYEASFNYLVEKGVSGLTRFKLPTRMTKVISKYAPRQLAVLAKLKINSQDKRGAFIPATWGMPNPDHITVLLNSGVSKTLLKLYRPNGSKKNLECRKITGEGATAYDTECAVENHKQYDMAKTRIIRKNFDNFFKPIKLKIRHF